MPKEFDWEKQTFRQYLIKFSYIGTGYSGLAYTDEATRTIEREIFRCLMLTKMIKSRETCNFSRCGRTDAGVHAAGNYMSISLREGIDHLYVLNKVLATDIVFLSKVEVDSDFNARFRCRQRIYKYYQPVWVGLDVAKMHAASQLLVGEHDFRNFCKMDVSATVNYVRTIFGVKFNLDIERSVVEIEVSGNGFLWHMIRCIIAILLLIGEGAESPELILDLLDLEKTPRKPLYPLAHPGGLVLFDCYYPGIDPEKFQPSEATLRPHREALAEHLRLAKVLQCMNGIDSVCAIPNWTQRKNPHKPLKNRATGPSLEEKVATLKRKLDKASDTQID